MAVALSQAGAETAVAYFDQAVRLVPNDAAALYGRGKARQLKGDIAGGNADVSAAEKIDPKILPPGSLEGRKRTLAKRIGISQRNMLAA
jgi:tetratricopeptide (TPR) repeat protein